jgi:hypothetical protein
MLGPPPPLAPVEDPHKGDVGGLGGGGGEEEEEEKV